MSISFPNASRSYDPSRRRVRFWGYDSALEIAFFVDADALVGEPAGADVNSSDGPSPERTETAVLQAFDDGLDRIHEVAAAAYARGHGYAHALTAADF